MFGRLIKREPFSSQLCLFFFVGEGRRGQKSKFPSLFRSRFRSFEMCALRFFGFEDKRIPAGRNQVSVEGRERKGTRSGKRGREGKSEEKGS